MSGWLVAALIVLVLVPLELMVLALLVRAAFAPLAGRYPSAGPPPSAVRREFQSIKIGAFNLGGSVHLAADERCLHVVPAGLPRWLGAKGASVPWDAIEVRSLKGGRGVARVRGVGELAAPSWALRLAGEPAQDGGRRS